MWKIHEKQAFQLPHHHHLSVVSFHMTLINQVYMYIEKCSYLSLIYISTTRRTGRERYIHIQREMPTKQKRGLNDEHCGLKVRYFPSLSFLAVGPYTVYIAHNHYVWSDDPLDGWDVLRILRY